VQAVAMRCLAGEAWRGKARQGEAWRGKSWQA